MGRSQAAGRLGCAVGGSQGGAVSKYQLQCSLFGQQLLGSARCKQWLGGAGTRIQNAFLRREVMPAASSGVLFPLEMSVLFLALRDVLEAKS